MKKSELYAKYYLFGEKIEEIIGNEFYSALANNRDNNSSFDDGMTSVYQVNTDGMTYYMFGSIYNVGGDYDGDNFFCKVQCCTQAERDEIVKLFGAQY